MSSLFTKVQELLKLLHFTRHSWGEMYTGHGRLCVCPSPHSYTNARTRM